MKFAMADDLKARTAKGIGWGFTENILGSGIFGVANIILAHILSPEDFGIIGMTAIFLTLSNSLVDSGFANALTRKKEVTPKDLDTVFYFNLTVSSFLYAVLYFTAPYIAGFFGQEVLTRVIRILSLSLIINAFGIVHKILLYRSIDFRTQAWISFVSSLTAALISIICAFKGMGLWSLVILQLVRITVGSILLWAVSGWHPGFRFSISSFKEMFAFGSRLLITSIMSTVWSEIYSLIIGKVYTPATLGLYSRAEKVKAMFTSNIGMVMQRVSYPVLSKVQDESQRQVQVYRKVFKTTVLLSFTAIFGLWAVAEPFMVTVFGKQWLPAVSYLRILCFSGLFLPLMLSCVNVINADGRSDITLRLEVLKTLFGIVPVLFGIFMSVDAMLWSMIFTSALLYMIHAWYVSRLIDYSVLRQLSDIFPIFLISLFMALIVNLFNNLDIQPWLLLIIQVAVGGLIIVLVYELVYRSEEYRDIRSELQKFCKSAEK